MIYNLFTQTVGAYTLHFDNLDGDISKVNMVDKSPDRNNNTIYNTYAFRCGRRIDTEYLPTKIRPKRKSKIPDFVAHARAQICSEAFREVIEAYDPGVHQFEPVQIVRKDGSVEEGTYYWFIPCTRLWSLDPELSNPPLSEYGRYLGYARMGNPRPGPIEPVFRKAVVKDHDVFAEAGLLGYFYMSERLKTALLDAKLTGVGVGDALPLV